MHIGGYFIDNPIALAPMAGITDKPFRRICREFGAGWAVCEMLTSDPTLRHAKKTLRRSDFEGEGGVVAVQIAGSDPQQMAEAARYNVGLGAQVIDINMGCPAKKVCNVQAGSALMQNEPLVAEILGAVVNAVDVPVTLKTRLGWHDEHQNLPTIAKIAEESGIATAADGIMIGRGAQGRPWLFRDLKHYAEYGVLPPALSLAECNTTILNHIRAMHEFYGEIAGVRIARKHIGWYIDEMPDGEQTRREINRLDSAAAQYDTLAAYLETLPEKTDRWVCHYREG